MLPIIFMAFQDLSKPFTTPQILLDQAEHQQTHAIPYKVIF